MYKYWWWFQDLVSLVDLRSISGLRFLLVPAAVNPSDGTFVGISSETNRNKTKTRKQMRNGAINTTRILLLTVSKLRTMLSKDKKIYIYIYLTTITVKKKNNNFRLYNI